MYEFGVYNIITNERKILFGYNATNALKRAELNTEEWQVEYADYID